MADNPKKIIQISAGEMSPSCLHMQKFSEAKSLNWQVELFPAFDDEFLKGASGCFVDFAVSTQIFNNIEMMPSQVRDLECFDAFLFDDGKWYPREIMFEAIRSIIVERARELEIRNSGYVIGDDELGRVMASTLVDLGFSTIYVVGKTNETLDKCVRLLSRKFIGIKFIPILAENMTMQMTQASVLLNGLDLTDESTLFSDLSYFNFMKKGGLIVDVQLSETNLHLEEEAYKAELKSISAKDITARRDIIFLDRCGLINGFTVAEYEQSWEEFLKSHPLSSYKKRHS